MRKYLTVICLLTASFSVHGQITLEHTFPTSESYYDSYQTSSPIHLSLSGKKFMTVDTTVKQYKLYNPDYTLWKTINFPTLPATYSDYILTDVLGNYIELPPLFLISETLFNHDTLIEFVGVMQKIDNNGSVNAKTFIMNEKGDIVHSFGKNQPGSCTYFRNIVKINDNDYRLILSEFDYHNSGGVYYATNFAVKHYSLPGTLPCPDDCNNDNEENDNTGFTEIIRQNIQSEAIPNPSSNSVTITYTLPAKSTRAYLHILNTNGQQVKSMVLDRFSNHITINNQELSSGVYYYNIIVDGTQSVTRKMVIVK